MGQSFKRTTALSLSAIMTVNLCTVGLSRPALAIEPNTDKAASVQKVLLSNNENKSRFTINADNPYMTRLRFNSYEDKAQLQIAFLEEDRDTGDILITNQEAHQFLDNAKIQINGGEIWSFEDAGFSLANHGNGESNSSFETFNSEFIRQFIEADELHVAIEDFEGNLVEADIANKVTPEERDQFIKDFDSQDKVSADKTKLNDSIVIAEAINKSLYTPESIDVLNNFLSVAKEVSANTEATQDEVDSATTDLTQALSNLVKTEQLAIVDAGFDEANSTWAEKWGITFNQDASVFADMVEANEVSSIEINSTKFEGKDNIQKVFRATPLVKNLYLAEGSAEEALKSVGKTETSHVVISFKNGTQLTFGSEDVSKPDTDDTKPEVKPVESNDSFNTVNASLVKFTNHDTESMSGATMHKSGYMLRGEDGVNTAVLYFSPATINGILAYATDLTVDEEISHKFILTEDNSAVCIVKLPGFEGNEHIFDAHIYSSVMDSEVGLKLENITKTSDVATALTDKVNEANNLLSTTTYFPKTETALKEAIKNAQSANTNKIEAYASLVECMANLREKLSDPFVGDDLFFVSAQDTSVVGKNLLEPMVRVDVDGSGNKTFTGVYGTENAWWGLSYVDGISVYTDDSRTNEIKVTTTPLDDNKFKFSFTVSDIPASGVFKAKIKEGGKDNYINTDIVLDYASLRKGPQKSMLQDAIKQALSYKKSDFMTMGDLADKKDDFTKASWDKLMDTVEMCQDDLKTDMTQDDIDKDIASVLEAREALVYAKGAGHANTANMSVSALNNPNNYYVDSSEFAMFAEHVGWLGSRIVFGNDGDVYRVLNNGSHVEGDKLIKNNKILIMAEDARAKAKFSNTEAKSLKDASGWDKSPMRSYLNNEYLNNSFSKTQQAAILDSVITTSFVPNKYESETVDDIITTDKIFAPSADMLNNIQYGFGSNDARMCDSRYGTRNITRDSLGMISVVGVKPKGNVEGTFRTDSDKYQTAPCMNIDASKVLMTIDAHSLDTEGIKSSNSIDTNLWKLVLKDDSLTLDSVNANVEGSHVSFSANTNASEYMAVVVEGNSFENGTIKSFGKVKASGFELPETFDSKTQHVYLLGINDSKGGVSASTPCLMDIKTSTPVKPVEPVKPVVPATKQVGTVDVVMLKDESTSKSMANDMFATKADVEVNGDNATIKLYVAYPIPAFKDQGKQGTVTDFKVKYNGITYTGAIDITSNTKMTVKKSNSTFGLVKGETIAAEVIEFTVPKSALKASKLDASCVVNVVMNSQADFDMKLENLQLKDVVDDTKHKVLANNLSDTGRIVIDANADEFRQKGVVKVDGKKLDKSSYNVTNGSTIITLTKAFLDSLTPGEHILAVSFNDGSEDVTANFTTKASDGDTSGTGSTTGDTDGSTTQNGVGTSTGGSAAGGSTTAKPSLNFSNLSDGIYSVIADMMKPNKSSESMANKALDHNVKLEVKGGKYYAIATFKGIKVGAKMGYLGDIKYADDSGNLKPAEVVKSITVDGKSYPQKVRIPLSKDCVSTGWQKLQIFVQTMEDIAEGSGTQEVYMKFDTATVKQGFSANNSFYGTIAETKSQRLAQTSDTLFSASSVITTLVAGAASIALSFKRRINEN